MTGKPSRKPGAGEPWSSSKEIALPFRVQVANELYDSDNPRSSPLRPGKPTSGMLQLKLRERGSSPPPPVRLSGSNRASRVPVIVALAVAFAVAPRLSVTVKVTVYEPAVAYVCDGAAPLPLLLLLPVSPKFQA